MKEPNLYQLYRLYILTVSTGLSAETAVLYLGMLIVLTVIKIGVYVLEQRV